MAGGGRCRAGAVHGLLGEEGKTKYSVSVEEVSPALLTAGGCM